MAFEVVMFGGFTLDEAHVEEWLTTPIEPASLPWLNEVTGDEVLHDTPEALLACFGEPLAAPHEFLHVDQHSGRVQLQAYLSEDAWREHARGLALLVASAADFGGVGEVHFMGYQGLRFAHRLRLRGARATFMQLPEGELDALEKHPSFQLVDARIHERFDALVGRPLIGHAKGSQWLINPFTGRRVRAASEAR